MHAGVTRRTAAGIAASCTALLLGCHALRSAPQSGASLEKLGRFVYREALPVGSCDAAAARRTANGWRDIAYTATAARGGRCSEATARLGGEPWAHAVADREPAVRAISGGAAPFRLSTREKLRLAVPRHELGNALGLRESLTAETPCAARGGALSLAPRDRFAALRDRQCGAARPWSGLWRARGDDPASPLDFSVVPAPGATR